MEDVSPHLSAVIQADLADLSKIHSFFLQKKNTSFLCMLFIIQLVYSNVSGYLPVVNQPI